MDDNWQDNPKLAGIDKNKATCSADGPARSRKISL